MIEVSSNSDIVSHPSGMGICAKSLSEFPWLKHIVTTRNYSGPDASRKEELLNVKVLLGTDSSYLVHGEQKHTDHIELVRKENLECAVDRYYRYRETDALVCDIPNVTIAIMTADCAPIFLVDCRKKVMGLVHAGWKGTLSGIAGKTVSKMVEMGSNPHDILAWIGPMAGACCYEVSKELIDTFKLQFPEWTINGEKERHLDLTQINCEQLRRAGLLDSQVHNSNICTIHNCESFYSYRADKGTHGRILSAMVIAH